MLTGRILTSLPSSSTHLGGPFSRSALTTSFHTEGAGSTTLHSKFTCKGEAAVPRKALRKEGSVTHCPPPPGTSGFAFLSPF